MSPTPPENQAILLTAPGTAAIAVVRLCGPGVDAFLQRRFSRKAALGRCVHGELRDGERVLDDPVVVRCGGGGGCGCGPGVADVNLHGGAWVVRSVLELATGDGFAVRDRLEPPLPPEAVDGENQIETEMLQSLPLARTELALRVLLAQPAAWAKLRRDSAGRIETGIAQQMRSDRGLHWLLALPGVAIVGPANVGKSTLANQLYGQERSITADLPGTTRDWVGEIANMNGLAVQLIDTPGRRNTSDPIEAAAIAASADSVTTADLVVVVLDASQPLPSEAQCLLDEYPDALCVANKADRQSAGSSVPSHALPTVATTGDGVEALRLAILRRFGCENLDMSLARCWTDRQRAMVDGNGFLETAKSEAACR